MSPLIHNVVPVWPPGGGPLIPALEGLRNASVDANGISAIANITTTVESDNWVLIVDDVLLVLTIVGALTILLSMLYLEVRGRAATTRMRLVQSLVVSDFMLGLTGTIGVSLALSDDGLHPGKVCDGIGTVFVATIWSEHMWTLLLAFATFMILIHPLHPVTVWLEKRWYWLWLGVWTMSFALSVMGYKLHGYVPSGGICYYPASAELFGDLIQFIPRGIVFITITVLYARLFVFLRRPDRIRSPYSDSPTGTSYNNNGRRSSPFGLVHVRMPRFNMFRRSKDGEHPTSRGRTSLPGEDPNSSGEHDDRWTAMDEIPPWEKVELPVFQVDGQKYGGASANVNPGQYGRKTGGSKERPQSRRPNTGASVPNQSSKQENRLSLPGSQMVHTPLQSPTLQRVMQNQETGFDFSSYRFPQSDSADTPTIAYPPGQTPVASGSRTNLQSTLTEQQQDLRRSSGTDSSKSGQIANLPTYAGQDAQPRPQPSLSDQEIPTELSDKANLVDMEEKRRKSNNSATTPRDLPYLPEKMDEDGAAMDEKDDELQEDDEEMDLMKMLKSTAPPRSSQDRFAAPEGDVVLVEESMASYLNRKTSLLMLWFPLGYVLIFSVSLIRIIYDFVGTPPVVLRAISRWFIFAQGVLDALIYGLVEWQTKRVVRRRVRKIQASPNATGTPVGRPDSSMPRGMSVFSSTGAVKSLPRSPKSLSTPRIDAQISMISDPGTQTPIAIPPNERSYSPRSKTRSPTSSHVGYEGDRLPLDILGDMTPRGWSHTTLTERNDAQDGRYLRSALRSATSERKGSVVTIVTDADGEG